MIFIFIHLGVKEKENAILILNKQQLCDHVQLSSTVSENFLIQLGQEGKNVIVFIITVSDQFRMNLALGKIKVKSN